MPRLGMDNVPEGFEETWEALIDLAVRPLVPAALLAAQAIEVTRGADWPVRRAAMEALLYTRSGPFKHAVTVKIPPWCWPIGRRTKTLSTGSRAITPETALHPAAWPCEPAQRPSGLAS